MPQCASCFTQVRSGKIVWPSRVVLTDPTLINSCSCITSECVVEEVIKAASCSGFSVEHCS